MKKVLIGIIIMLLVACIAVEGVIIYKQANDNKVEKQEQSTQAQVEDNNIEEQEQSTQTEETKLPESTTEEGEYLTIKKEYFAPKKDELVYTYLKATASQDDAVYEIPQININSTDVERINKRILEKYNKILDGIKDDQGLYFMNEGLEYKYYKNNNILSLVMCSPSEAGGCFGCELYNIDLKTNKQLWNDELLEKINLDEEQLNSKIMNVIDNVMKKSNYDKEQKETIRDIVVLATLANDIENLDLYINKNGNLSMYLSTFNLGGAGGDSISYLFDLETEEMMYELD